MPDQLFLQGWRRGSSPPGRDTHLWSSCMVQLPPLNWGSELQCIGGSHQMLRYFNKASMRRCWSWKPVSMTSWGSWRHCSVSLWLWSWESMKYEQQLQRRRHQQWYEVPHPRKRPPTTSFLTEVLLFTLFQTIIFDTWVSWRLKRILNCSAILLWNMIIIHWKPFICPLPWF